MAPGYFVFRDFIRVDPLDWDRAIVRWLEDNGREDYKLWTDLDRLIENLNSDSPSIQVDLTWFDGSASEKFNRLSYSKRKYDV
uniref:Uncharacterized protein n=1 Tax=Trichogramma kaykai TaxID=54128 RepID=A0ABD2WUB8_9HYME